jgi:tetratricopeptide (TPR) repeat protein
MISKALYAAATAALFFCTSQVIGQEACEYVPSSKVQKMLENSKDSKKYSQEERFEFLEKAIEEEAGCLPALQRLGELHFLKAKRTGAPFTFSRQYFEKLIELCPEYHSEPYYFLGAICYADKEYDQALTYFEKFQGFPDSDPTKFEKDYQKKYDEVTEALPNIKTYKEIYGENISYNPVKVVGVSSKTSKRRFFSSHCRRVHMESQTRYQCCI